MKTTKFTSIILAIFFVAVFAFTACSGDDTANTGNGSVNNDNGSANVGGDTSSGISASLDISGNQVVIKASSTGGSLEDAMSWFKGIGKLSYEGEEGDYGFYLTSVNSYTPDAENNEYWAIYTTLGEYEGVEYSNSEYGTYDYNGKTCASASYGISGIPMVEGEIYIITVATY